MKTHDYELVEERFEMNVNVFCYENKIYPIYISKKSNTQVLNVLLITSEEKSHYVFIKDFDRLMYSKVQTKNQHKKFFCMACVQNFTTEEILSNHKKQCLLINGCQAVNYESGTIKFKNYEKLVCIDDRFTLPVIFKGDDCVNKFIWWVINQNKQIKEIIINHFNKEL